jgi:antitoxin VapB
VTAGTGLIWDEGGGTNYRGVRAQVFQSGNSQAVRLPKQFRLNSQEVEIFRRGDEIILREKAPDLTRAFELLCELPDFDRQDAPPQEREGL